MRKMVLLLASLLVLCAGAQPQNTPTVVIKAGRLIDTENGRVLENQVIIIRGDTIRAVGAGIAVPAGATVIDLSKATVLPGLIDCLPIRLFDAFFAKRLFPVSPISYPSYICNQ